MSQDTLKTNLDSLIGYQYRITFTQINGLRSSLIEDMSNFFKTKVDYCKDLDQYIIISDKDLDQHQFSENFSQEITLFKKIKITSNL